MPPWSLITLKYARMPSMYSWYRPPIGLVFAVMTATRIVVLVTPFTPGRAMFCVNSAALAVVNGVLLGATVVGGAVCDFELPHAATATLMSTAQTRSRERIVCPPGPVVAACDEQLCNNATPVDATARKHVEMAPVIPTTSGAKFASMSTNANEPERDPFDLTPLRERDFGAGADA